MVDGMMLPMIVLYRFPWRDALRLLRQRFREDRLGQAAGSLTFTTTIALVPLVTVALAVFTAFPGFSDFQTILQKRLVESLVPENISRQVLGYLTQFASKASRLGAAGVFALMLSVGASVVVMTQLLNFTRGLAPEVSIFSVRSLFGLIEFILLVWGVSALYRYVPYAQVRWSHALVGGLWVALAAEVTRKLLVVYFGKMTTYWAI